MTFRNQFSEDIFNYKYRHDGCETWADLAETLVLDVCNQYLPKEEIDQLTKYISDMKFIPGGRYLYYAGRPNKYYNNCYLLKAEEDTREGWANLGWKAELSDDGGGIGADYSVYRPVAQQSAGLVVRLQGLQQDEHDQRDWSPGHAGW